MSIPPRVRKPIPLRGRRSSWPGDAIGDEYSPNALNVRFRFGEVRQTPGRNVLSGPETSEAASVICQFPMIDGATIWPMKLATTKVMRWGNISPANPRQWHQVQGTFVPVGTRRWSIVIGENKIFFCRGDNTIAYWDGLVTSKFQQIVATDGGTVPRARFLQHLNSHLVGAFTIEALTRLLIGFVGLSRGIFKSGMRLIRPERDFWIFMMSPRNLSADFLVYKTEELYIGAGRLGI